MLIHVTADRSEIVLPSLALFILFICNKYSIPLLDAFLLFFFLFNAESTVGDKRCFQLERRTGQCRAQSR